jgi:hypothetical protein
LQHFQSFLLCLCPRDLVSLSILNVLSPIGIGRYGIGLKLQDQGEQFLIIEDFFIIVFEIFIPDATDFPIALQSILFLWLFSLSSYELRHKLRLNLVYGALEIIRRLFLLAY